MAPKGYAWIQQTVVRLIARQQGIGGYDSWGAHCNDIYKNKQKIEMSYKIDRYLLKIPE